MSAFSEVPTHDWLDDNEFAFALRDPQPISPGHVLIVSKRQVPTWFEATHAERLAILDLIDKVKRMLDAGQPPPHGYSVGFDVEPAARQAAMHLHVHVIPRRDADARGGMRNVVSRDGGVMVAPAPMPATARSPLQSAVASRPLPPDALERARELVATFMQRFGGEGVLQLHGGRRARVLGPALEGGVRIVGPDTGFVERTVSEFEVAWVITTLDAIAENGGPLDVARVGSMRGRDAESPHSVDTAWAIALVNAAQC